MVTQEKAEELAQKYLQQYLNECGLDKTSDAGKALMKMLSVTGVMMVATVGYDDAVQRMYGTASFIEQKMVGVKFIQQTVN
ncbi:hypothetical protein N7319_14525 [Aeromonas dhakensis]|uniref:hypothetical protein n=1 Tax=Aeromonas TaxID=642 RepID=UPI0002F0712C|nr:MULTISPECIES: hypothetical protein [Aeromonas]EHK5439423.1 hypothetical protein [Aeromonas hydrophila]MDH0176420.1 hypothetical protein [Aeromonas dhakensis]RUQ10682.1 hypothetical protein CX648_21010 [Aeromonas dhakensis]